MSRLLKEGSDIERRDSRGETPLLAAAINGEIEIAKILIEKGADVLAQRESTGMRPLDFAAKNSDYPMARLLLSYGAAEGCREPMSLSDEYPALHVAERNHDIPMVKILLSGGCQQDARDRFFSKPR